MTRNTSRVTRKGQVTIPIEFRRSLGIQEGDRVEFVRDNGTISIKPVEPAESSRITEAIARLPPDSMLRRVTEAGAPYRLGRPVSITEMKAAATEGWTERERRYLSQRNREGSS